MQTKPSVTDNMVVGVTYRVTTDSGEVVDSSEQMGPLHYLHGHHQIISGLEKGLAGMQVGQSKKLTVPPLDAYGLRAEDAVSWFPREAFSEEEALEPGMVFYVEDEEDDLTAIYIREVEAERVLVDYNHPLAGETLHFEVAIVDIRPATPEELAHGHAHDV